MSKRKFAIVTDSAADMPAEYYEEHKIAVVNLGFTMNNVNYAGDYGEKISERDFYAALRGGAMPTTYQVTAEMAKPHIEALLKKGEDVLVLTFSSGLSGTSGSFTVAARELSRLFPKRQIKVVDSLSASMGQGLLLDYIVKKADEGASLEDTVAYAEDLKLRIVHHFTVDSLAHLKRGGRISATAAILGSILKIKPIMHVSNEGRLEAIGKVVGRKRSLSTLVDNLFALADMGEDDPIFISHGDCIEDVEYVKSLILAKMPNVNIVVNYIGAVIGSHSGAGTVAVFHKGKKRMD